MKKEFKKANAVPYFLSASLGILALVACSNESTAEITYDDDSDEPIVTELHAAYAAFNTDAVTVYLEGSEVVIETTGLPNHETTYWGEGNALYREEPDVANTPSIISSNNNATTIRVDATPNLSGNSVTTDFNTIGIVPLVGLQFSMIKKVVVP
ncbi:hypothetical protein [Maribacter arcticus]|uniref:Uncharacterized protein n=1 Tax=Maribacter arcticus TaxID=561365 RepID=A0A1T5DNW8_9FLAO|nr:hypothetical protein [Maribacter arcticus]SKB73270.1 hypothetical protein SAMN05660866_03007 [Maribacter arcticus]